MELLVALALTAMVGGAAYKVLVSQGTTFLRQDQLAEAQQNARVAMDHIVRELRMAGYNMAHGVVDGSGNLVMDDTGRLQVMKNEHGIKVGNDAELTHTNTTKFYTNNDTSQGRTGTDALFIRRAEGTPWTIDQYIYHENNHPLNKIRVDGKYKMGDNVPDYVLIMCPDKTHYCTQQVTFKGPDDAILTKKMMKGQETYPGSICSEDPDGAGPLTDGTLYEGYTGGTVIFFRSVAFYIGVVDGVPMLMKAVNGFPSQVVARYIEDLQVAYMTVAPDGTVTWYRGGSGTVNSDPPSPDLIRTVRVSVVARTRISEKKAVYDKARLEDNGVSGSDNYLRRVLTTEIKIRNYGID